MRGTYSARVLPAHPNLVSLLHDHCGCNAGFIFAIDCCRPAFCIVSGLSCRRYVRRLAGCNAVRALRDPCCVQIHVCKMHSTACEEQPQHWQRTKRVCTPVATGLRYAYIKPLPNSSSSSSALEGYALGQLPAALTAQRLANTKTQPEPAS